MIFSIRNFLGGMLMMSLTAFPSLATSAAPVESSTGVMSALQPRQWQHPTKGSLKERRELRKKVITGSDAKLGPVNNYGILYSPTGAEWVYTADFVTDDNGMYTSAKLTIYDDAKQVLGTIDSEFALDEHDIGVNFVQINPNVSKKFFNVDDKYEVIIYVHVVTDDYVGRDYQLVYSVAPDQKEPLMKIDGNQVLREDFATDQWSEKYQMVMMREEIDPEGKYYYYHFDVYDHASYASLYAPQLLHTFTVDFDKVSDMGGNGLPIALRNVNGKPVYALFSYEKPYFDENSSWLEPEVNPDNNLVIDVYDGSRFNAAEQEVKPEYSVKIPIEQQEGFLYSFPTVGAFMGNEDFSFGVFSSDPTEPYFIVTTEKYETSSDDFIDDFKVYDRNGKLVKVIAEDVEGYLQLMPIAGNNEQFCFYNSQLHDYFSIVELPSCEEVTTIPFELDGYYLSTAIDRVPTADGYQYAIGRTNGVGLPNGDIVHSVAWFDSEGNFDHYDDINLGSDVMMAQLAIVGEWLNPYLFNTDSAQEYMFIVKVPTAPGADTMEEHLWIRNAEGKNVLDFGPDKEMGGELRSVMIGNATGSNPVLIAVYNDRDYDAHIDHYILNFNSLPLTRFEAGGDGTADSPYIITTPGDLMCINDNPGAYYELGCDIDFGKMSWSGVAKDFTGTLDGKNHVISNLQIDGPGIFNTLVGAATVKNLVLDAPVAAPIEYAGAFIAGSDVYDSSMAPVVENVHIYGGKASADDFTGSFGSIVGMHSTGAVVKGCSVQADIALGQNSIVGGIVGEIASSGATVQACVFKGTVNGGVVGGIVGDANAGQVKDCNACGATLEGAEAVGGIIGQIGTFRNNRPSISSCFAEVTLVSANAESAQAGGVAGTVEAGDNPAISNCLVWVRNVTFLSSAKTTVHNIAGATCADELGAIDWESPLWDEIPDLLDHPESWPRLAVEPDKGLLNNYYINCDAEGGSQGSAEDAATADGAYVAPDKVTAAFLAAQEWSFGSSVEQPWVMNGSLPALYFQVATQALAVDVATINAEVGDVITLTYTVFGGSDNLEVEPNDMLEVQSLEGADVSDGDIRRFTLTALVVKEGNCDVVAKCGELTASTRLNAKAAGVGEVVAAPSGISFDGRYVTASSTISLYTASGVLVARGAATLDVSRFAPGVYVAVSEGASLKIAVR